MAFETIERNYYFTLFDYKFIIKTQIKKLVLYVYSGNLQVSGFEPMALRPMLFIYLAFKPIG